MCTPGEFVFSGAAVPGDASRHVSQKPVSSDDGHDITTVAWWHSSLMVV